jgi:hypothetical protein
LFGNGALWAAAADRIQQARSSATAASSDARERIAQDQVEGACARMRIGVIEVSAREIDGSLHVEVSDQGKGLPQGFDIDEPRASLGFKVITGMVRQLRGHLTVDNDRKGSRFLLELPIILRSDRSPSACPERHGRMGSRGRILELDNLDCEASKRTSASHAPQIFLTRFGGGQVIVSEQSAGGQRSSFMWVRPTYSRRRPR